ncbi:NTP/NDP exchange transporter [Pseudolysobacter antarcticus]|uniref:NTP/NDP exchange transporter n=1 Tax=Pseudolysobacter antarcticus TaxID=2511995 RepID=UPI001F5D37FF|nr:MFS transporter [Pseudolysobacter antarcticus]
MSKSGLSTWLRTHLWVDIRREEWPALALSFAYFFFVLGAYYVIRPVREQLGALNGSASLPLFYALTFVATLILTPVYGALVANYSRKRFIPLVYVFFILCLLAFIPLFEIQGQLNPRVLGAVFFVWVSVFNLFVVSVFWSFMADIFSVQQSHRLFGVIALGGTIGAVVGPLLAGALVGYIGIAWLLAVSAGMLLLALACIFGLIAWSRRHPVAGDIKRGEAVIGGSMIAGAQLVLGSTFVWYAWTAPKQWLSSLFGRSATAQKTAPDARTPFLRRMALLMLLGDCVGTVLFAMQFDVAKAYYPDAVARTQFFAHIDLATNALIVVLQATVARWLLMRYGPTPGLVIPALVKAVALLLVAALATPLAIALAMVFSRAGAYGMEQPARESLYTRVDRETRYKAKNFIDTAVWRFGDFGVVNVLSGLRLLGMGVPGFALLSALAASASAWLGWRLVRSSGLAVEHHADQQAPQSP